MPDQPSYEQIAYEVEDAVLTITLDRPDRLNAFTSRMMFELIDAFDRADADDDVRAIIVTGRGRGFCAGADLEAGGDTFDASKRGAGDTGDREQDLDRLRDGGGRVALRIYESLKPVIAAINGPAVGVGATMTLPMDIRLAGESARMGFVFSRRGITMEACSSWFLPRVVGVSQAAEWVFSGRVFPAQEALDGGLVRSVHPDAELLDVARGLAREIADNTSAMSVALNRQMMWRMLGADHPMEAHKVDSRAIRYMGASSDVREGVESFLEKRAPRFTMRPSADMPEWYPWWEERPFE
ncbi:crotonase/enoyl-CoA hydratase family protein [Actinomarinicola tropica]|uniref:Enoyl-CoA hydratase n=1 Tax=Actinomarinicola tropica TaxID=2789776 RepID=A0A5Q2RJ14_9ACTN|nr:crotonase/enoyl-CoA hydratase family protein [Actinomarinicola tropica]QGG95783.1 enoyl-CoA hydratase [Actinomarinicola tropica]